MFGPDRRPMVFPRTKVEAQILMHLVHELLHIRLLAHAATIQGWLSQREAVALYRLARLLREGAAAMEIGCWKGKSAFCLTQGLRRGRLTVIDPFDASGDSEAAGSYLANAGSEPLLQQFTSHMNRLGVIDKIDIWHGTSQDYVGLAQSVELLFIDGDH